MALLPYHNQAKSKIKRKENNDKQFPVSYVKAKFGKPGPGMAELSLSEEQMQTRQQQV